MANNPTYADLEKRIKELENETVERKEMEETLRNSENQLKDLLQSIQAAVVVHDSSTKIVRCNEKAQALLGLNEEQMLGKKAIDPDWNFLREDGNILLVKDYPVTRVLEKKRPLKEVMGIRRPDRENPLWVLVNAVPVFQHEGKVFQVIVTFMDISEHRRAETALRESENKYRNILETMQEGYFEVDLAGNHTFFNDSLCKMFGYTRDEFAGINFRELNNEEDSRKLHDIYSEIYRTGVPLSSFEFEITDKKGTGRHIETSAALMRDNEGKATGFMGIAKDVTERKNAEHALEIEKEKFKVVVEKSPLGIALIDKNGRYFYINLKFEELFGYGLKDVPDGKAWFEKAYPDPEYRKEVMSIWKKDLKSSMVGESRPRTFHVTCLDGSRKEILFRSVTMETGVQFIIYEDVTEKMRLEAQFQQAQKMESIGTLAGGIAHDFNNLLTGIIGNVSLILLDIDSKHPHHERLKNIEQYVQSGADLTKQLLGFARGGKYEVRPSEINELIKKSSDMFGRAKKEVRIHTKLGTGVWTVDVDQGQIEQVLMNLYVNAWQAMPGGGDLFLQTENVILDKDYVRPLNIRAGGYVKISVTDTGEGMDDDTRARIFEPFFTTKEMGRGTGLGLASAYGIIKNHGGIINVYSEKGHGTTFDIYLPQSAKVSVEKKKVDGKIIGGIETILLVDDEDLIVDVGKQLLEKMGYNVMVAKSGHEAIEIYKNEIEKIDMVILDMIMPEMGGGEAYDRLQEIQPDVKVLLSSGYSINGQAQTIMDRGCKGFIHKPFSTLDLSKKLRQVLDGR